MYVSLEKTLILSLYLSLREFYSLLKSAMCQADLQYLIVYRVSLDSYLDRGEIRLNTRSHDYRLALLFHVIHL